MKTILVGATLLLLAPLGHAEALGRLFFSAEQRAMLDLARDRAPTKNGVEEVQAVTPSEITLNGMVTRSDGKASLWVNGRLEQGIHYRGTPERNQVQLKMPAGGVKLKVGQTYDPANDRVEESYRRAHPPSATHSTKPAAPAKPPLAPPTPNARDENLDADLPPSQQQ